MIDFKDRDDVAPSAMIAAAILLLVGTLVYMVAVPAPSAAGVAKGRDRSRRQIEAEIETAKERTAALAAANAARLWRGDDETVMSQALAQLTTRAARDGVQVAAFRPQRRVPHPTAAATELPFTVQLTGPYPAILRFVAAADASVPRGGKAANGGRLVLRSMQIASSDPDTDAVTANVSFCAYLADDPRRAAAAASATATTAAGGRAAR